MLNPKTALVLAAVSMTACALWQKNIDARKYLEKCKYEFERIEIYDVHLDGLAVSELDFAVFLRITNTTDKDVALDRIKGDILVDEHAALDVAHERFVRIPAGSSVVEKVDLTLPFESAKRALGRVPENLGIDADVFVTLLVGDEALETPFAVHVNESFPIPYDEIAALVKKKTDELVDRSAKKKVDRVKESAKKRLKKLGL